MKAVVYGAFLTPPALQNVPDPSPTPGGVVIKVMATGICRSDWHGWAGHDPDIVLPHVPGHELAGIVEDVGRDVKHWTKGDRVTVPFVGGCGDCTQCSSGNHQVCDNQFQPGFTQWGSFAEFVAVDYADINLVALPGSMDFPTAASLGCRLVTAFRAVVDQGVVAGGQWVAVHGCGGVGLSAVMIANGIGANVIAVDISDKALALAKTLGANATVKASEAEDVLETVREISGGGVHVSLDALGHSTTCANSIRSLRKRGKHVQVGLMAGEHANPAIPMSAVIANELELLGSHGMQAHRYDALFGMIRAGKLAPEKLIGETINLEQAGATLMNMDRARGAGVTIVTEF